MNHKTKARALSVIYPDAITPSRHVDMLVVYPNAKELSKHIGELVVAVDGKIIAHGKRLNIAKVVNKVIDKHPEKVPFVLRVPKGEQILKAV
jgi:hypothetical protein